MKLQFSARDCLEWAVAEKIETGTFEGRIISGPPLRIKLGIDPTSPDVHLGRSIPLWRLRAFQELGHEIHFILGNFTAQIGDTSDKESERPQLSEEFVEGNLQSYMEQVWQILNPERKEQVHIHRNAEWLDKLSFGKVSQLADLFSVNSFIKRELIAKRLEAGGRVSLREMLYPLMQGYDSVAVKADIELGGTDQRFNLLAGRTLQERFGQVPQGIITNHLVAGTDGRKMSSSWGNTVSLRDSPKDKFGKVMSIPDPLIVEYLYFLPFSVQPFTADEALELMSTGTNPRDLKLQVAFAITALYHGESAAETAQSAFSQQFSQREPTHKVVITTLPMPLMQIAERFGDWSGSRSELRRVFQAGGVELNGVKIMDPQADLHIEQLPATFKVGKKILIRLVQA